jgi:hypothetical protein
MFGYCVAKGEVIVDARDRKYFSLECHRKSSWASVHVSTWFAVESHFPLYDIKPTTIKFKCSPE